MKRKIVKTITWIATIVLLLSIMFLDLDSNVPIVTALLSLMWLSLFVVANREYLERNYG